MVLVGMRQDHGIDPAIPRRDAAIERHEQPVGIGAAVDEQPAAVRTLDEDGVALTDIEHRDPWHRRRPLAHDSTGHRETEQQGQECGSVDHPRPGRPCRLGDLRRVLGSARFARRRRPRHGGPRAMSRPPQCAADRCSRGDGGEQVGWRLERHAGEGQTGRGLDDGDEDLQDDPARRSEYRAGDRRPAGQDQRTTAEGHEAGTHRRRDERHDDEVDDR